MGSSKNPLMSKTVQGIIVAFLAYFLPKLGLEVDQSGLAGLIDELCVVLGLAWGIYGRAKATKPIRWKGKAAKKLLVLFFVPAVCCASLGCAHWGDMSGPEKARTFGYEAGRTYIDLHDAYGKLRGSLGPQGRQFLSENVAPALNTLRDVLVVYNDAVIAWSAGTDPDVDLEALKREIQGLIADIVDGLVRARTRFELGGGQAWT